MAAPSTEIWVCAGLAGRDDENWIALDKDFDTGVTKLLAEIKQRSVFHATDLSYIRVSPPEPIDVGAQYDTVLSATRIAFKNPGSTKWWFGCVDHVEYVNDGVTRIYWVEDIFNNWWGNRHNTMKYVVREHTNDDTIGANTEPENVELGPYVTTATTSLTAKQSLNPAVPLGGSPLHVIVCCADPLPTGTAVPTGCEYHKPGIYGGVPQPFYWHKIPIGNNEAIGSLTNAYSKAGKADSIIAMFTLPENLFATRVSTKTDGTDYSFVKLQDFDMATLTMPSGFSPTNNKLYTYPYCTLALSTNSSSAILRYELFDGAPKARVAGGFGADASCTAVPKSYGGQSLAWQYAVTVSGFPILAWTTDAFKNWMGQNWGKTVSGLVDILLPAAAGAATGSIGTVLSSVTGTVSTIGKMYDQQAMPNNAHGAAAAQNTLALTDMTTDGIPLAAAIGFYSYCRTCKKEYMQIIDDHFSRLGYATNKLKTPNFFGRKKFNFVQLANPSTRGAMPQYAKDYFDRCLSHGVTLWHDIGVGDYYGSNAIVTS